MKKLKTVNNEHISEAVIKVLSQNHIINVLDFLREDAEKLSVITKLNLSQIIEIRNDIFHNYSALITNGADLFVQNISVRKVCSTGIDKLDLILNGGVPIGFITEICGIANSGKTQLCMQIAINCALKSNNTILYIDTKGDFSAVRIQRMLDSCHIPHKDMAMIMLKIKVIYVWNIIDLLEIIKKLMEKTIIIENLSLIIIDSLPSLMFQYFGEDNKIGLTYLNNLVNNCRSLCKLLQLAIICVNIETRWIDQDVTDLDDDEQLKIGVKDTIYIEKRTRCLGRYWQHIPKLVIKAEPTSCNAKELSHFLLTVTVSTYNIPQLVIRPCTLDISIKGVN